MILSKCVVRDSTKMTFLKKQEAGGLLSNLRLKTPLKRYCTPEKAYRFIFSTETLSKNMTFKKNWKSKSRLDQKLCQFLFFHCDAIFNKLSKLGQISCVIPYYTEIYPVYLGKTFVNLLENWY